MLNKLLKILPYLNEIKLFINLCFKAQKLYSPIKNLCNFICTVLHIFTGINLPVDQLTIIVFSLILVFLYWKDYFPFYYSNATLTDKLLQNSSQDKYH